MTENNDLRQYVKQNTTKKSITGRVAVIIAVAAVLATLSQIKAIQDYMLIIAIGIVFISSAFMKNFSSEYEYRLDEEDFFIDRIYGVSKHKELFCFSISDITDISEDIASEKTEDIRDFSSSLSEFSPVFITLRDETGVILSLNNELKSTLSRRASE